MSGASELRHRELTPEMSRVDLVTLHCGVVFSVLPQDFEV